MPGCIVPKELMSKLPFWKAEPPLMVEKEAGLELLNMSRGLGFWGAGSDGRKVGCWENAWFCDAELVWKSSCILLKSSAFGGTSTLLAWNCVVPKLSCAAGTVETGSGWVNAKLLGLEKLVVSNMCRMVLKSLAAGTGS